MKESNEYDAATTNMCLYGLKNGYIGSKMKIF